MRLYFDFETDNLLCDVTKIHCLETTDLDTGEERSYGPEDRPIEEGIEALKSATLLVGQNVINYDIPVLRKLRGVDLRKTPLNDTLVMSRMLFPELKRDDLKRMKKRPDFPRHLIGMHSLKAWGHRLQNLKGSVGDTNDWSVWTRRMQDYCRQDVRLGVQFWKFLMERSTSQLALEVEHLAALVLEDQRAHGVRFDEKKGGEFYLTLLGKRTEYEMELQKFFPPWVVNQGLFMPKVSNATRGITKGCPFTKVKLQTFTGTNDQIADRLQTLYGWKPKKFGDNGKPTVDEAVLSKLSYPCMKPLLGLSMIEKKIGQLAEGRQAWLKVVTKGRIHGTCYATGAVTSRCSHASPNLGNVPKVGKPYGRECRELFLADEGHVLVGADASGLELRMLGHYLAKYDGGEYARLVVEGDVHSRTVELLGCSRDTAKTFIYAWLYGAGPGKIAAILKCTVEEAQRRMNHFVKSVKGLTELKRALRVAVKRGWIKGLDGRRLPIRHEHAALNTALQGGGAVVMKHALVIYYTTLEEQGIPARPALFVHDEFQTNTLPEYGERVGQIAVESIVASGRRFNLRVPLSGEYKVGSNWAETH